MVKKYINGETFLYLGEPYTLTIGNYKAIEFKNNLLLFPQFLLFRAQKELEIWYKREALQHINKKAEWYALRMGVKYLSISVADTKSRWGACDPQNRLQFNWRLIMTPHAVLDSVVVHELAHIHERNHSLAFWLHVRRVMPGYKAHRAWINYNQEKLVI